MKRVLAAALLSTLLCLTLAGALIVNLAAASTLEPPAAQSTVTVQLPENKVYTENSIPVAFTVEIPTYGKTEFMCTCILDYRETVSLSQVSGGPYLYSYTASLSGLSEGEHRLGISVSGTHRYMGALFVTYRVPFGGGDEVFFTVNAAEPRVRVLSPRLAKTYNATTLPLDFTVSESVNWLGYSLDGEAPVTVTENSTLAGLSEGTHSIVVHAEDAAGSTGASSPVTFKVETQTAAQPTEPQSTPFPAVWIVVAIAVSVVVATGLLFYLRKRKR